MKMMKWAALIMGAFSAAGTAAASPLDIPYEEMALKEINREGTLIFSDSPEYASLYGILAEGTVSKGKGKIYYYHVNNTGKPARLVVYGISDNKTKVQVTRRLRGDPSKEYVPTGRTLSFREVTAPRQEIKEYVLEKGRRVILFEENEKGIKADDLVSGIVEVVTDRPVKFGTAFVSAKGDIEENLDKAEPLPPDTHEMRGTFPKDVYFENEPWNILDGPKEIILGSQESKTPFFITGRDELNLISRENTGNYGITCHITIHSTGTGSYDLYINPMGGVFEGTLEVGQVKNLLHVYRTDKTIGRMFGHETIYDYKKLGTWQAGRDLYIRFIPPGACYLPIRFLLIPKNEAI